MARPKQDSNIKPAFERIEDAFWDILAEKNYDKITIVELSKRAKVNHNLIYYYFDNIDDMAKQLFDRNMADGVPQRILGSLMESDDPDNAVFNDEDVIKRVMRTRLFMRKDSAFLNEIVKARIMKEWILNTGVDFEQLTPENKVDLEFIFSGIVAVLGSETFAENQEFIATLYKRALGKGIIETFKTLV